MNKNLNDSIYLVLHDEGLKATKKSSTDEAIETYGSERKDELMYGDTEFRIEAMYLEKDTEKIEVYGDMFSKGKKIGYISLNIPLTHELWIEIIEQSMKKLGKFKTVMEAIK